MLKSLFTLLIVLPIAVFAQQNTPVKPDSNQKFIINAFNKADVYMDTGSYDSAQIWLNKIYIKLNYQKPSFFCYFVITRQAEIYYYNNLPILGMQEAKKAVRIAKLLKDSILISDALNFIGLFNLSTNNLNIAKQNFKESLLFTKQPPYNKQYYELSKPHHICGNLAETFIELKHLDSAIYYSKLSLQKATEINSYRGIATAYLDLGTAYQLKKNVDSAIRNFNRSKAIAIKSKDFDVELTCYCSLAVCALAKSNIKAAFKQLNYGFDLLKKYPQLNNFYTSKFLDIAIGIYKKFGSPNLLVNILELKSIIQTKTFTRNNVQLQSLLLIGLQNEKQIAALEIIDANNKKRLAVTKIYVLLLLLVAFLVAFIAYRYYALQELRLANLRTKISQDLHDEIGATLSGIALYSYITNQQIKNNEHNAVQHSLELIKNNATDMVAKLNDIVWAINPKQDNFMDFIYRLKEFSLQIASAKNIEISFLYNSTQLTHLKLAMQKRKNIYLICKEAINNAVKYSESSLLNIQIKLAENDLKIEIIDNGIGFLPDIVKKGNGLDNMALRAKEIKADFNIDSTTGVGTKINLTCKIP